MNDDAADSRARQALTQLASGTIAKLAGEFFRTAVLDLARLLHADTAFIARRDETGVLRTVALARCGVIVDDITFAPGSACQTVLSGAAAWIKEGIRDQFPGDPLLTALQASGFAAVPIPGAGGTPIGIVAVAHNAPLPRDPDAAAAMQIYADRAAVELDRAEHERSLIDEKEYVENLIDTANVVIIEIDAEGRIRLVNRAFEQLTGVSRTAIEGVPLLSVVSDASAKQYVITSGPHDMEASLTARDGEQRLLRLRANDVRRAGRAVGTILFGIDITEERRAEERQQQMQNQIARAAEEWRSTFDSVLTPILLVDGSGRIARLNRAARELGHQSFADSIGTALASFGDGEPFLTAATLLADAGEGVRTAEATDSEHRSWAINVMPFASPGAAESSSIVVLWDITRMVTLQESVRISEQMSAMGELVAGVAHEVRNPLFGISAALDAFEEEFGHRPEFQEYIVRLRTDADRLDRLMNDLLEYGRPADLRLAARSFAGVIEHSVRACEPVARQKKVAIETGGGKGSLPHVVIDRDRLVQVFKNIIENAIAFTPGGSTVTIDVHEDRAAQQLVTTVTDSGPGFRENDLPRVFTPFFTRRRGGTGLGLPIARRIIGDHGGTVAVRNADGGGAIVEIRLPLDTTLRGGDAA